MATVSKLFANGVLAATSGTTGALNYFDEYNASATQSLANYIANVTVKSATTSMTTYSINGPYNRDGSNTIGIGFSNSSLNLVTSSGFSIETFINFPSMPPAGISISGTDYQTWGITVNSTGFAFSNPGYVTWGSGTGYNIQANTWYHLALIGTPNNNIFFAINGQPYNTANPGGYSAYFASGTTNIGQLVLSGNAVYSGFRLCYPGSLYDPSSNFANSLPNINSVSNPFPMTPIGNTILLSLLPNTTVNTTTHYISDSANKGWYGTMYTYETAQAQAALIPYPNTVPDSLYSYFSAVNKVPTYIPTFSNRANTTAIYSTFMDETSYVINTTSSFFSTQYAQTFFIAFGSGSVGALQQRSNSNYIVFSNSTLNLITNQGYSFEFFVNFNTLSTTSATNQFMGSGYNDMGLAANTSTLVWFNPAFYTLGTYDITGLTNGGFVAGKWYHFAIIGWPSTNSIYFSIDGNSIFTNNPGGASGYTSTGVEPIGSFTISGNNSYSGLRVCYPGSLYDPTKPFQPPKPFSPTNSWPMTPRGNTVLLTFIGNTTFSANLFSDSSGYNQQILSLQGSGTPAGTPTANLTSSYLSSYYITQQPNILLGANAVTIPFAQRVSNTTLYVSGYFDEVNYQILTVNANILLVGGGGGGASSRSGNHNGGGGGAGGVVSANVQITSKSSAYIVTVGPGGSPYTNGSNSVFTDNNLVTVTALGGGGGGANNFNPYNAGLDGGSGGGGAGSGPGTARPGGNALQPTSTNGGLGNAGGTGYGTGQGGGGGGAGSAGGNGVSNVSAGNGGDGTGLYSALLAAAGQGFNVSGTYYIAAGGGGAGSTTTGGNGGVMGGNTSTTAVANGAPNSGTGGGSGQAGAIETGAYGGSGLIIIQYASPTGQPLFTGGTISYYNSNIVHTFTYSGTLQ